MSNDTNHIIDAYVLGAACWFEDKEKGFITGEVTKVQIKAEEVELEFKDERGRVSLSLGYSTRLPAKSKNGKQMER
jgi:myosin heavy subunit